MPTPNPTPTLTTRPATHGNHSGTGGGTSGGREDRTSGVPSGTQVVTNAIKLDRTTQNPPWIRIARSRFFDRGRCGDRGGSYGFGAGDWGLFDGSASIGNIVPHLGVRRNCQRSAPSPIRSVRGGWVHRINLALRAKVVHAHAKPDADPNYHAGDPRQPFGHWRRNVRAARRQDVRHPKRHASHHEGGQARYDYQNKPSYGLHQPFQVDLIELPRRTRRFIRVRLGRFKFVGGRCVHRSIVPPNESWIKPRPSP